MYRFRVFAILTLVLHFQHSYADNDSTTLPIRDQVPLEQTWIKAKSDILKQASGSIALELMFDYFQQRPNLKWQFIEVPSGQNWVFENAHDYLLKDIRNYWNTLDDDTKGRYENQAKQSIADPDLDLNKVFRFIFTKSGFKILNRFADSRFEEGEIFEAIALWELAMQFAYLGFSDLSQTQKSDFMLNLICSYKAVGWSPSRLRLAQFPQCFYDYWKDNSLSSDKRYLNQEVLNELLPKTISVPSELVSFLYMNTKNKPFSIASNVALIIDDDAIKIGTRIFVLFCTKPISHWGLLIVDLKNSQVLGGYLTDKTSCHRVMGPWDFGGLFFHDVFYLDIASLKMNFESSPLLGGYNLVKAPFDTGHFQIEFAEVIANVLQEASTANPLMAKPVLVQMLFQAFGNPSLRQSARDSVLQILASPFRKAFLEFISLHDLTSAPVWFLELVKAAQSFEK